MSTTIRFAMPVLAMVAAACATTTINGELVRSVSITDTELMVEKCVLEERGDVLVMRQCRLERSRLPGAPTRRPVASARDALVACAAAHAVEGAVIVQLTFGPGDDVSARVLDRADTELDECVRAALAARVPKARRPNDDHRVTPPVPAPAGPSGPAAGAAP